MLVTIQKWGNSQGIRIPKRILDTLNLKENEVLDINESDGNIIIKRVVKQYSSLDDLFADYNYTGDNKCEEYDFGEDVGKEII